MHTIESNNNKLPISVFIICQNEEDRISYAINSVASFASEIIIIDSGSTDSTIQIVQQLGITKIYNHKWEGYGQQKRYGESLCQNDWILNIDADEEVSENLKAEIRNVFQTQKDKQYSAFKLSVEFCPRFKNIKETETLPNIVITRLYNKQYASFKNSTVHDSVVVSKGKIGNLKGCLIHRCFRSFTHAIEKINGYSSMQAQDSFDRGKEPSVLRILAEPIWTFFKSYFIKRYVYLGIEGVLMALLYSMQRTIRLIKTKEKFLQKRYDSQSN